MVSGTYGDFVLYDVPVRKVTQSRAECGNWNEGGGRGHDYGRARVGKGAGTGGKEDCADL